MNHKNKKQKQQLKSVNSYRHNRSISINVQGNDHYANYAIENLKMQSQLRKIQKYLAAQKELQRSKVMIAKIQHQLQEYQERTKLQKKQMYTKKIQQIKQRNHQREKINKVANKQLAQISEMRLAMKAQLQKKIIQQKKQFDKCYSQALQKRKKIMRPLNFQELKKHQLQYLQKFQHLKPENSRYKSPEVSSRYNNSNSAQKKNSSNLVHNQQQEKRKKIMNMIVKRNQYGNKMQIEKRNERVKTQVTPIQRQKIHAEKFKQMLDHQRQLNKLKKSPLAYRGQYQKGNIEEIKLIKKRSGISDIQKIQRLNELSDGYKLKYQNGKIEALDLMSEATLAKADVFLNNFS